MADLSPLGGKLHESPVESPSDEQPVGQAVLDAAKLLAGTGRVEEMGRRGGVMGAS